MVTIESTTGVIVAVNGVSPGPASGITYDVYVNIEDVGKVTMRGIVPHTKRWPDTVDTVAADVGDTVSVHIIGKKMQFFVQEIADTAECP